MKATDIFIEFHAFVELADDFVDKKEKFEKSRFSGHQHDMNMSYRNLKTAIAKFRMINNKPKTTRPLPQQGGFNFLAK